MNLKEKFTNIEDKVSNKSIPLKLSQFEDLVFRVLMQVELKMDAIAEHLDEKDNKPKEEIK